MEEHDRLTKALADRYRIEREIGSGGTAMDYLAHNPKYDRAVVLEPMCPQTSSQS